VDRRICVAQSPSCCFPALESEEKTEGSQAGGGKGLGMRLV